MCRCAACKNHFLKHFWGRATDTRIEAWALLRFPGRNRMKQDETGGKQRATPSQHIYFIPARSGSA